MRVIAGSARGRRLVAPKGRATRPTPDRVREALFSILGPRVPDATVLDLFAGTGALGIEALSRGARRAVFVEHDRTAAEHLRRNLDLLGPTDSEVLTMTVRRAIDALARRGERFTLIFLDPPFAAGLLPESLLAIVKAGLCAAEGLIVCEHDRRDAPAPPPGLTAVDQRRYGEVALTLFSPERSGP